jgi:hypothetical protein
MPGGYSGGMHPGRVLIVECDRCHRPLLEVAQFGQIVSAVRSADGTRTGATMLPGGIRPSTRWSSSTAVADSTRPVDDTATNPVSGRFKVVCVHRRGVPRTEQPVTAASLRDAYDRAAKAGRTRIGLREIR